MIIVIINELSRIVTHFFFSAYTLLCIKVILRRCIYLNEQKKLFALDIGTRSVVGIILEEIDDENYHVLDILSKEHSERAMMDGQIHDVLAVSKIINRN